MISVIIPCYNCAEFIEEAVNSILKQSFQKFEVILIDDCSKDNTFSLIKDLEKKDERISVYRNNANLGAALTRNKGVELAIYEYIAFLDSDDVWNKEKLKIQIEYLIKNSNVDVVVTSYELFDEKMEERISCYNTIESIRYKKMLYENLIGLSTVVMKREVYKKFKMTNKYIHEDYELWLKLLKNGYKIDGIKVSLVKYRVFANSINANKIKSLKGRFKILYKEEKVNPILICKYI